MKMMGNKKYRKIKKGRGDGKEGTDRKRKSRGERRGKEDMINRKGERRNAAEKAIKETNRKESKEEEGRRTKGGHK